MKKTKIKKKKPINELYHRIGRYLEKKQLGFCFLPNGEFVSREQCEKYGYKFN